MERILLAGATGYLGKHILEELQKRNKTTRIIERNSSKLEDFDKKRIEVFEAEVTKPKSLEQCCDNIDTVISTVGITRQKDGLTYLIFR